MQFLKKLFVSEKEQPIPAFPGTDHVAQFLVRGITSFQVSLYGKSSLEHLNLDGPASHEEKKSNCSHELGLLARVKDYRERNWFDTVGFNDRFYITRDYSLTRHDLSTEDWALMLGEMTLSWPTEQRRELENRMVAVYSRFGEKSAKACRTMLDERELAVASR